MDDPVRITRLGEASCRNLRWFFDVCAESDIDPQQLVRNVPYTFEHLSDPGRFIDWQSYSTFISNFRGFLSADELAEFARITSYPWSRRACYGVLRYLRTITEVYDAEFGEYGPLASLYPCRSTVTVKASGNLRIDLVMLPGHEPCEAFHYLIKGQLAGLGLAMGSAFCDVAMSQRHDGARFFVTFDEYIGPLILLRRRLISPLAASFASVRTHARYLDMKNQNLHLREEIDSLKQAEALATQTESRYRLLATHGTDVIWTLSNDLRFQFLSPSIETLTGYTVEEAMSMALEDLFTPESYEQILKNVTSDLSTRERLFEPANYELQIRRRDGNLRWLEVTARFIVDGSGAPLNMVGISRDITERKEMELELAKREENYRIITTTARDGIVTLNEDLTITFVNPAMEQLFGYTPAELIARSLAELVPELAPAAGDLAQLERLAGESLTAMRKDGSLVPVEISFAAHRQSGDRQLTGVLRDVTQRRRVEQERKTLEHQLHASQKMESIGQLTGGIAHDFNNLLVAILGYTDLAMNPGVKPEDQNTFLGEIRNAGQRAADMTQKLLAFSRRQIIEPTLIDLNALVDGVELMIRRLLPENIDISIMPATTLSHVLADPGQLEQVIINLAVNARDAMHQGGRLVITTENTTVSEAYAGRNPWAHPGAHILLKVTDTGAGMNEEVLKRVFEPFFTTKPEGSGTGLGLAVVFGIVKQHNGFIDVESFPGRGTTFRVYLPVAAAKSASATRTRHKAATGGDETILIVEDNQQVGDLARLILRGAGYRTLVATDGHEALEIFGAQHQHIDLVLMDVVMPRMGGRDVMREMRAITPDVRILFTSGYSSSGIHTNFILEEGLEFIPKPYSTNTLRSKVRSLLDQPPSPGISEILINSDR